MRILGIDPGKKNIGIALSDPTGTLAKPLTILRHTSRPVDAASIATIATNEKVDLIVVGQALDQDGYPTVSGRSASRLASAIREQSQLPVVLWDESHSTKKAQAIMQIKSSRKQQGHKDDLAAAVILQSYLDAQHSEK